MQEQCSDHVSRLEQFLRQHFVTCVLPSESAAYPLSARELLREDKLSLVFSEHASRFGYPQAHVIGTVFAKRYSVWVMGLAAAFSLFDSPLSVSLDKVRVRPMAGTTFHYATELETPYPSIVSETDKTRRMALLQYRSRIVQHIDQVFQSAASLSGSNTGVMWSLVAHNVQQMYEQWMANDGLDISPDRLRLIRFDYEVLLERQEEGRSSPLAMKLKRFSHPGYTGRPLLLRRYCCLAHCTVEQDGSPHGYCATCPKLKDDERMALLV